MNNKQIEDRLTHPMMIGYGSGDFAIQLAINSVVFYLLYFYTDVFLIPSAIAGTIILFSRIIQAAMNPVFGILSDKIETRWGKKRPFILIGAIPFGFCFFLLFAPAGLISDNKEIYAFITSLLFLMSLSFTGIPYASLASIITHDSHERSLVSGWRMAFALLGSLTAAAATRPLVSLFADEGTGFRFTAMIYAVIIAVILIITFRSVTEKKITSKKTAPPAGLRDLRLIIKNGPFLIVAFASLFLFLALNTLAATVNYYFKYVLNAEEMIWIAFTCLFAAAALAIPVFLKIAAGWGKKNSFILAAGVFFLVLVINYFAGIQGPAVSILILTMAGAGISGIFLFPWSLMPDTVEYMQWKTGYRREGMLYGFFVIFFNLSAALAGLVTGMGLELAGYVPHMVQDRAAMEGIFRLMTIVPAASVLTGIVILLFYPLNEAGHIQIVNDIRNGDLKS